MLFVFLLVLVLLFIVLKPEHLIIVTSHWNEDLSWLKESKWPVVLCDKEGAAETLDFSGKYKCPVIPNKGAEASSYLNFIIHNYDNLPDYVAFIHGHEKSWHQSVDILEELDKGKYIGKEYFGLNYWCRKEGAIVPGDGNYERILYVWDELFRDVLGDIENEIMTECCAQFVVSRSALLRYSLDHYKKWYNYVIGHESAKEPGYVFEYVWHILFGEKFDDVNRKCLNTH